jgi:Transposase DDE domain/Domain of unknown function (DUF4372)
MKNSTTIFNQLLNLIPYGKFQKVVDEFNGDKYTKKFTTYHQFTTLLYAQITEKDSIRDIEKPINFNKGKLQFFSLPEIKRSTFSDANNRRDCKIFEKMFSILLEKTMKLTPQHKFKFKNPLYSLDASTIKLCLNVFDWAKYRKRKGAIKIHTKFNHNGNIPDFLVITDGKCSDIRAAKTHFDFLPDSIVVMDKGYIDFEWLFSLHKKEVYFVTRAKSNMAYEVTGQHQFTEGTGIISDEEIVLTCKNSLKAYSEKLRMVKYYDIETNKVYTFITNNFKLAAKTIADIYKDRWQVELFFKWIKQNLKIKSFLGTTPNAVMSQIWVAMTAYLIYSYIKFQTKSAFSILDFSRMIKETLFQKVSILDLLSLNPDNLGNFENDVGCIQLKLAF